MRTYLVAAVVMLASFQLTFAQNRPNKKASLILVSFDNSPNAVSDAFQDLVQNAQVNYSHCFSGYQKSVLLKKRWNGSNRPTHHVTSNLKNEFFSQLKGLARDGYMIDIYIFTHGSSNTIHTDFGTITATDIRSQLYNTPHTNPGCFPIRMVYMMNCYGSSLGNDFRHVGAKVVAGPRDINFYPNQFNKFATEWKKGNVSVQNALNASNTASSRTVFQTLIVAHSNTKFNFRKCIPGSSVLGTRPCAKDYFQKNWMGMGANSDWQNGQSGKENMNYSSQHLVSGEGHINKNSRPTWCGSSSGTASGPSNPSPATPTVSYNTLLNTTGNVLSARRGKKTSQKSGKDKCKITVRRTGGRAKTQVSVYTLDDNNREVYKAAYEFPNTRGSVSPYSKTITGVRNKKVVVYLRNSSAANTFQYSLTVKETR